MAGRGWRWGIGQKWIEQGWKWRAAAGHHYPAPIPKGVQVDGKWYQPDTMQSAWVRKWLASIRCSSIQHLFKLPPHPWADACRQLTGAGDAAGWPCAGCACACVPPSHPAPPLGSVACAEVPGSWNVTEGPLA